MHPIGIGTLRGLQRIARSDGFFDMTAMDHRGSMQRMIGGSDPAGVSAQTLTRYKLDLCAALAPHSSAVLLDPVYGAAQAVASGDLPREVGLLVGVEATGYSDEGGARLTEFLPGWGVEKVRRMGADAAKILVYYHPGLQEVAARQREVTRTFVAECRASDLPALVEPVAYPILPGDDDPAEFARRKPELVARTARELTPLGVDVLKAEFPTDARFERDEARMLEACQALDAASSAPWILLSAGVSFEVFEQQVRIASQAGASGFLVGRALWQEAMAMPDTAQRRDWLETVAVERLRRLGALAREFGKPWWNRWAKRPSDLLAVDEGWYQSY